MLFKKLKQWFGPKVCGELYAKLLEEHQELELEYSRQALRAKAVRAKNESLHAQINEWSAHYQRLKITFGVMMTEAPSFEDYAQDMQCKNKEIEQLSSLVHELSFKNNKLERKLEKNSLIARSSEWCSNNLGSKEKPSNVTPFLRHGS